MEHGRHYREDIPHDSSGNGGVIEAPTEVNRFPSLTGDQEKVAKDKLGDQYNDFLIIRTSTDPTEVKMAIERIVVSSQNILFGLMKQMGFFNRGIEVDDLRQEGLLILMRTVEKFDMALGLSLSALLRKTLKGLEQFIHRERSPAGMTVPNKDAVRAVRRFMNENPGVDPLDPSIRITRIDRGNRKMLPATVRRVVSAGFNHAVPIDVHPTGIDDASSIRQRKIELDMFMTQVADGDVEKPEGVDDVLRKIEKKFVGDKGALLLFHSRCLLYLLYGRGDTKKLFTEEDMVPLTFTEIANRLVELGLVEKISKQAVIQRQEKMVRTISGIPEVILFCEQHNISPRSFFPKA